MSIEDYANSDWDGLTEDEIKEKIDAAMKEDSMSEMEKLRRDNPSLRDAWEQIKTIRALSEQVQEKIDSQPSWERHYFEIVEGVETNNAALRAAWDQYYTMKKLLGK